MVQANIQGAPNSLLSFEIKHSQDINRALNLIKKEKGELSKLDNQIQILKLILDASLIKEITYVKKKRIKSPRIWAFVEGLCSLQDVAASESRKVVSIPQKEEKILIQWEEWTYKKFLGILFSIADNVWTHSDFRVALKEIYASAEIVWRLSQVSSSGLYYVHRIEDILKLSDSNASRVVSCYSSTAYKTRGKKKWWL